MPITVYMDKHNESKERKSFQNFLRREKLGKPTVDHVFISQREFVRRAFVGNLTIADAFVSRLLTYAQRKRWMKLNVSNSFREY